MTENGSCSGCFVFKGKWCSIIKAGGEEDCPCRNCLVKIMCKYSCEEYKTYVKKHKTLMKDKKINYLP